MDKAPTSKTTPKSQLIVFSPEVLKKLGIATQLSKLTNQSDNQLLAQSLTNAIQLNTNKNNDDNNSQLKLALNTSNTNQIKPNEINTTNETNANDLLLNVETSENNENNVATVFVEKPENKQKLIAGEKTPDSINKTDETDESKCKETPENVKNAETKESSISIKNAREPGENEIDSKFQLDVDADPRVVQILTPAKRGRPKRGVATSRLSAKLVPVKEEEVKEIEIKEEKGRRRSGRQRKEKKLDDIVYYTKTSRKIEDSESEAEIEVKTESPVAPISPNETDDEDEAISKSAGRRRRSQRSNKKKLNRIESDEEIEKTPKKTKKQADNKLVECGVCKEKMANGLWNYHCSKHNYLCWRVGETPIDLQNRKACETILLRAAANKKVVFTCENCGEKRKSVVGYMSHLDVCQKTEEERLAMRVTCPECHKLMQPCSLKIHMRNHLNMSSKITNTVEKLHEDEPDANGGRVKRSAAKKAQGLINKFTSDNTEAIEENYDKDIARLYKKGSDQKKIFSHRKYTKLFRIKFKKKGNMTCPINKCDFMAFDLSEAKRHIENCPELSPEDYICFACFMTSKNKDEIEKHILQMHIMNQQLDEDNDDEDEDNDQTNDDESKISSQSEEEDDEDEVNSDQDDENGDLSKKSKHKRKESLVTKGKIQSCADKIKFLKREVRIAASSFYCYPPAGKWTLEFSEKNYSLSNSLMDSFFSESKWLSVPPEDYDNHIPPTQKSLSVKTVLASKKLPNLQSAEHDDWKEFDLFETEYNKNSHSLTIFCGGPVWELSWVPTPADNIVDQILAVSVQRDYNMNFKTSQSYASAECIQFWNFGKLHFADKKKTPMEAKLFMLLAHNHGNVWCMEWCPSGCYDLEEKPNRRMGLLALACTDLVIPIYSVYFPDNTNNDDGKIKMFKPIECCKLLMQDQEDPNKLGNWNYQCTKLTWSKLKGHNIIAAGYSNGVVCLWDLSNDSSFLKNVDQNGTALFRPYFCFQPHAASITALHFYYPLGENAEVKWLFIGSWDRNCALWDLEEPSNPVFVFNKRGNITDGAFINHWLCTFLAYDDVHFLEHTTTSIQNFRDFGYKNCSLLAANSMVMGLSASDWANAIAHVSLAGELCCTFQRQLLVGYDVDKATKIKRFLLTYCETIDKNQSSTKRKEVQERKHKQKLAAANTSIPENYDKNFFRYLIDKETEPFDDEDEALTYEEAVNKYGLIFCDIPLDDKEKIPPELSKMVKASTNMRDAPTEMYPILAQNRVAWNPNKQGYIFLCSGYHAGFVRLRCVRFMHSNLLSLIK